MDKQTASRINVPQVYTPNSILQRLLGIYLHNLAEQPTMLKAGLLRLNPYNPTAALRLFTYSHRSCSLSLCCALSRSILFAATGILSSTAHLDSMRGTSNTNTDDGSNNTAHLCLFLSFTRNCGPPQSVY